MSTFHKIYRWLLRLFPFDFRREYGEEMGDVFKEELEDAGPSNRERSRLLFRTVLGLIKSSIVEHWDVLRRDIRYGVRSLARTPGFTFVAIATLGVGIGANVAVFSVANGLIFKSAAVGEPEGLLRVGSRSGAAWVSNQDFLLYRNGNGTFSSLAGFTAGNTVVTLNGFAERTPYSQVSGNYFETLKVPPAIGRTIDATDDLPDATPVVVIGNRFWHRAFGKDPEVLGRALRIGGVPHVVIGVMPPAFRGVRGLPSEDLWVALKSSPHSIGVTDRVQIVGRLKDGISKEQAQTDLSRLALLPDMFGKPSSVVLHATRILDPESLQLAMPLVGFVMAIVGLGLVIACLNIANLQLARSAERRMEIGIRISLGAGRGQIVRQFLTESFVLSVFATVTSIAIALIISGRLTAWTPFIPWERLGLDFSPDGRVILFAALLSLGTPLFFGLAPALQSVTGDISGLLKGSGSTTGSGRSRLRSVFVVSQVALSTILLVAAGSLAHAVSRAEHPADQVMVSDDVLTANIDLYIANYVEKEQVLEFIETLLRKLESVPGLVSASMAFQSPIEELSMSVRDRDGKVLPVVSNDVTHDYFRTLEIPLLQGRDFTTADSTGGGVGIVNEALAQRLFLGESPIGKRIGIVNQKKESLEIVGLVRNTPGHLLQLPGSPQEMMLYRPLQAERAIAPNLLVKTKASPAAFARTIQTAVRDIDPTVPVTSVTTLDDAARIWLFPMIVSAALAAALGVVVLIVGTLGLYGMVSYVVRQRTKEIGIRIALGAQSWRVIVLLIRQALTWTGLGLGLGLLVAFSLSFIASRFVFTVVLFGDAAIGILTFSSIALVLAATSLVACWIPAQRAVTIDPAATLREE